MIEMPKWLKMAKTTKYLKMLRVNFKTVKTVIFQKRVMGSAKKIYLSQIN